PFKVKVGERTLAEDEIPLSKETKDMVIYPSHEILRIVEHTITDELRSVGGKRKSKVSKLEAMAAAKVEELAGLRTQNDKLLDSRLSKLNYHVDSHLYHHMLIAIAGRSKAISLAIDQGIQEGLEVEVEHGKAEKELAELAAYDLGVKSKYEAAVSELEDVLVPFLDRLEDLKDASLVCRIVLVRQLLSSTSCNPSLRRDNSSLTVVVPPVNSIVVSYYLLSDLFLASLLACLSLASKLHHSRHSLLPHTLMKASRSRPVLRLPCHSIFLSFLLRAPEPVSAFPSDCRRRVKLTTTTTNSINKSPSDGLICEASYPHPLDHEDGAVSGSHRLCSMGTNLECIDNLDIDDLYNNLKVYVADIKGSSGSSSNLQNMDFVSAKSISNLNELNVAYSVSTITCHTSQAQGSSSYADELMFLFFANQSSTPQLNKEDLEQIDQDNLEEIDLKWKVAMLFMRVMRFYKKTRRKLEFNGKEPVARNSGNMSRDAGNARYRGRDNGKRLAK
nr:hypothetical protein [Tanacetum cinerariifolium]